MVFKEFCTKLDESLSNHCKGIFFDYLNDRTKNKKLALYKDIKNVFKFEEYLDSIKHYNQRRCLTKFRISSHKLNIERGRYVNINRNERLCKQCESQNIEDEFHYLMKCPKYSDIRKKLFSAANETVRNFMQMSDQSKFLILLKNESTLITEATAKFIHHGMYIRKDC